MRDRPQTQTIARYTRWGAFAVIAVSLLLVLRLLPMNEPVEAAQAWIRGLGWWGPVAFVLVYLACALVLLPCWMLTVVAGAVYGVLAGGALALFAATLAAAISFVLARHLLRDRIVHRVADSPRFQALDAAITEGGWKVVALVRLAPVFPFGVQNYLYGLTGIGFWACLGTTVWAMIPGSLLYAYVGKLTKAGATNTSGSADVGLWTLRIVGLVAGVVAVVYVTRLARRKLNEIAIRDGHPFDAQEPAMPDNKRPTDVFPLKTAALAAVAVLSLTGSLYAQFNPGFIRGLVASAFGPPSVAASEAFEPGDASLTIDHTRFDALLHRIVTPDGMVDYKTLQADPADLTAYLQRLAAADFDALGRDEKLATLINAYNAFTLQLMLDHGVPASIKDIPEAERWKADRWKLGKHTLSLDELEHQWLREKFIEPRIHFAIVCASVGCPPLRNEAYVASRINEQLDAQARLVFTDGSRWFDYDAGRKTVKLTQLLNWFGGDFEAVAGSPLNFVAQYSPELKQALDAGQEPKITWLDYDWSINKPR